MVLPVPGWPSTRKRQPFVKPPNRTSSSPATPEEATDVVLTLNAHSCCCTSALRRQITPQQVFSLHFSMRRLRSAHGTKRTRRQNGLVSGFGTKRAPPPIAGPSCRQPPPNSARNATGEAWPAIIDFRERLFASRQSSVIGCFLPPPCDQDHALLQVSFLVSCLCGSLKKRGPCQSCEARSDGYVPISWIRHPSSTSVVKLVRRYLLHPRRPAAPATINSSELIAREEDAVAETL